MYNIYLLMSVVTLAFKFSLVNSQVCTTSGWFGPNCQYKCHCENDSCNPSTGQCTDTTKCVTGWFGLGCQYQDLTSVPSTTIISNPVQTSNTWITDRDDSTCNQDIYLQSVVVAWNITYPFSWLRLTVKNNAYPGHFNVSFKASGNNESDCSYQRIYIIDQKTVDISCNMTVDVMQIIIKGQSITSLCSLYISGGRNAALKQPAAQSSTYTTEGADAGLASHAVDGYTDSRFLSKTCAHTNDWTPNWNVTFSQSHAINRIVLYNRFDGTDTKCCPERLIHFGLETFNASKQTVFSYRDSGDKAMLIYTVIVPVSQRHLPINGIRVNTSAPPYLTLCEVQTFGECSTGTWGLDCINTCNPSCWTSCHVETGFFQSCNGYSNSPTCDQECISTKWGLNCNNSCNESCYKSHCDRLSGICSQGCNGYNNPPNCTIECTPGTWGKNCSSLCSSHCSNMSCDRHSGKCDQGCNGYNDFPDCTETMTKGQDYALKTTVIGLGIGFGIACAILTALLILIFTLKRKQPLTVNYDTVTPGQEYTGQYETPEATVQYQNTAKKYEPNENGTLKQSNVQSDHVYEEVTTARYEYESIGLEKIDSVT